jgi:hypothetical protein
MLSSKDVEKLNDLCEKFEKDVIEYVENLQIEKGYEKGTFKVTLDYSPQYRYEQKELTFFQRLLNFLGFAVVDVGLHNQQALRLYTIVIESFNTSPYVVYEPNLSGLFYLNDPDIYPSCLTFFTQDLKKKIN